MTPPEIKQELARMPSDIISKWTGDPGFVIIHADSTDYNRGSVKVSLYGNEATYQDGSLTTLFYA